MILDPSIYVGDTRKLIPLMPDGFANLTLIDPPYGKVVHYEWDKQIVDEFVARELVRTLAPNGSLYICCGEGERSDSYSYFKELFSSLLTFKDHITVSKERGIGNRKGWMYAREEIQWWVKNPKDFVWNVDAQYSTERRKRDGNGPVKPGQNGKERRSPFKRLTNVWTDISFMTADVVQRQKIHPTPKPVKLFERIIRSHTKPGDMVFDCYAGVMTTWEACRRLERKCCTIELDRNSVVQGLEFFGGYGIYN